MTTYAETIRETIATLPAGTLLWLSPADFLPGDLVMLGGTCARILVARDRFPHMGGYDRWEVARPQDPTRVSGTMNFLRGEQEGGHMVFRSL